MKIFYKVVLFILLISEIFLGSDKKVLVEIFTNSHCPLCPSAHSAIDNYLQSANGERIDFIYYHMAFPYSDDQLYQHNVSDSDAKNIFYGPHSSTPKAFFDGKLVSNSYSNWGTNLDDLLSNKSTMHIEISAQLSEGKLAIEAEVTQTEEIQGNPATTINYVIVEDLIYNGRNGIDNHKNVMRKIVDPEGELFSISQNETQNLSASINISELWEIENIKIVAFIQNRNNKEVLQSATLSSSEFGPTNVENTKKYNNFSLSQNYPNPFNPITTIRYSIPNASVDFVSSEGPSPTQSGAIVNLVIYDVLGREVATLVNEKQKAGSYDAEWNATDYSSGIYFYRLQAGNHIETKRMILLK